MDELLPDNVFHVLRTNRPVLVSVVLWHLMFLKQVTACGHLGNTGSKQGQLDRNEKENVSMRTHESFSSPDHMC